MLNAVYYLSVWPACPRTVAVGVLHCAGKKKKNPWSDNKFFMKWVEVIISLLTCIYENYVSVIQSAAHMFVFQLMELTDPLKVQMYPILVNGENKDPLFWSIFCHQAWSMWILIWIIDQRWSVGMFRRIRNQTQHCACLQLLGQLPQDKVFTCVIVHDVHCRLDFIRWLQYNVHHAWKSEELALHPGLRYLRNYVTTNTKQETKLAKENSNSEFFWNINHCWLAVTLSFVFFALSTNKHNCSLMSTNKHNCSLMMATPNPCNNANSYRDPKQTNKTRQVSKLNSKPSSQNAHEQNRKN